VLGLDETVGGELPQRGADYNADRRMLLAELGLDQPLPGRIGVCEDCLPDTAHHVPRVARAAPRPMRCVHGNSLCHGGSDISWPDQLLHLSLILLLPDATVQSS